MAPLRARLRHPHHAFEIGPVITGRAATTATLRQEQRPDQRPLIIQNPNSPVQGRLQKTSLNQPIRPTSTLPNPALGLLLIEPRYCCPVDIKQGSDGVLRIAFGEPL